MHKLTQGGPDDDTPYIGIIGGKVASMQRESASKTPNGNPMNGRWVLRIDGKRVDFDQYRHDLAERNDIQLTHHPQDWE